MGILNIQLSQAGLVGTIPTPIYINTNDTYTVVTTTGYLNEAHQLGEAFSDNQMALVETSDYGPVWLKVVVSGANYSLSQGISPVGQYVESIIDGGSAVALTTDTVENITSIELSAGEWDVVGSWHTALATSTTSDNRQGAISAVSATLPSGVYVSKTIDPITGSTDMGLAVPTRRFSLAVTTTIYLVTYVSFAVSTAVAFGYIAATRVG